MHILMIEVIWTIQMQIQTIPRFKKIECKF